MSSSIPTSCTQVESTVLSAPIDIVWSKFREMRLDRLAPDYVSKTESSGDSVGSVVKVFYTNNTTWELRITEISDRNYTLAYEVLSSDTAMPFTSADGELLFQKISDTNETFLKWTTSFSNDADAQVLQDQKYKKLDFFKAFKRSMCA
mmetsp:Transcript_2988/g.3879  ORF Transcript_2988/g.3879 Transcript_2988/m.3879 type:complete len:148 (+) Transcript_2988:190-633(+)